MEGYRYIFILGSHPELSAAEAWSVLEAEGYRPELNGVDRDGLDVTLAGPLMEPTWQRLGGSERALRVIGEFGPGANADEIASLLTFTKASKVLAGISLINGGKTEAAALGNTLKEQARQAGVKLKFILPQKGLQLNAAQTIFNRLALSPNFELWVWRQPDKTVAAQTAYVQDIAKYELRDTARPARDAVVGMLPPKLAQIMLNLAYGGKPGGQAAVLDPFCGMGTILQEGWLAGFKMAGTDISDAMVAASSDNLDWVGDKLLLPRARRPEVGQHDAALPFPTEWREMFDAVVTEPDLGRPLRKPLAIKELGRHMRPLTDLYIKALGNIRDCLKPGGLAVIGLPAFRVQRRSDSFHTLPQVFLDAVKELGYSEEHLLPEPLRRGWKGRHDETLIYARPSALVGREIRRWRKM